MKNFRLNSVLVLALLQVACGKSQDQNHTKTVSIAPQFASAVAAFQTEAANQGTPVVIDDLIVQSAPELASRVLGECVKDSLGLTTPTIEISQPIWDALDTDGQQALIFHELGHCILNRAHDSAVAGQVPVSVMNPIFLGSSLYDANRAQYLYELFHQSNLPNAFPMAIPQNNLFPMITGLPHHDLGTTLVAN